MMEKEQWRKWVQLIKDHKSITWKIGLGILLFIVGLVSYVGHVSSNGNEEDMLIMLNMETETAYAGEEQEEAQQQEEDPPEEKIMIIDISGAVFNPGVVSLKEGSRVYDAVEGAGGLLESADTSNVNLAAHLSDGDKVLIPSKEQGKNHSQAGLGGIVTGAVSGGISQSGGASQGVGQHGASGQVNINQASSEQLQTLTGVGPAMAKKIIDYRESVGGFKKAEDLMNVSGIGTKTFEKIKDKISV